MSISIIRKSSFILATFGLLGCVNIGKEQSDFHTFNKYQWLKKNRLSYAIVLNDTTCKYTTTLYLRINQKYPYKNLSLLIQEGKDSTKKSIKRKDFIITKEHSWSSFQTITYTLQENSSTKDTLFYKISSAMKDSSLTGIANIGIKVEKK